MIHFYNKFENVLSDTSNTLGVLMSTLCLEALINGFEKGVQILSPCPGHGMLLVWPDVIRINEITHDQRPHCSHSKAISHHRLQIK